MQLTPPLKDLSFPLIQALQLRRTKRCWRDEAVSLQEIADLLWAACGKSVEEAKRSKSKRTASSGRNSQSICVYAVLSEGLYRNNKKRQTLTPPRPSERKNKEK